MNRLMAIVVLVWFACASTALAQARDCSEKLPAPAKHEAAQPILVLVNTDPWAMVMGADSPRFALYEDGLVIFQSGDGYKQARLDPAQIKALLHSVDVGALACVTGRYQAADMTDQPTSNIFLGRGGALTTISVYGSPSGGREGGRVPTPIVAAYERLIAFNPADAKPWMPEKVEVMVWPYDHASEPSIIWPAKWPGLDAPGTVRMGPDGYSIFLPTEDLQALIAFLNTRHQKGAVEIGGKKWSVDFRFPFPGEHLWMDGAAG